MLLELPQEVKNIFQTLPGGTPLQEYMEDLVQKSKGLAPLAHHEHKKSSTLLQNALETQHETSTVQGNVISGDFAKILANSLAQSNAEIIKEFFFFLYIEYIKCIGFLLKHHNHLRIITYLQDKEKLSHSFVNESKLYRIEH